MRFITLAAIAALSLAAACSEQAQDEAGTAVENIGSIRVLEKAGMTREGQKRKVLPLKKGWSDNYIYAILEDDKR